MPWRLMTVQDLEAVKVLADRIHVDHPEDMGVFVERLQLYPEGCHVLSEDGGLVGYALSHPWLSGAPPSLNTLLLAIPEDATTYYVHDVALLPQARGKGLASIVAERLTDHAGAAGFDTMSLVAVNRSREFWERLGFRAAMTAAVQAKLRSYGDDALLMRRDLRPRKA